MNEQEPARSAVDPRGGAGHPAALTSATSPDPGEDGEVPVLADPGAVDTSLRTPAQRSRTFAGILANTALANITTNYCGSP